MKRQVLFNEEASQKLINGINKVANSVKTTLGAGGRLVIIEEGGFPKVTKDGVSVANSIELSDPVENMGAMLLKQTAQKTVKMAGDGTSTSIVLAQKLIIDGVRAIQGGVNPVTLVQNLKVATSEIIENLRAQSQPIKGDWDKVRQIAVISMNGDEKHADMLVNAMKEIGEDGVVIVAEGTTPETKVEIVKGLEFESGYNSSLFVNSAKNEVVFENPFVFTTSETIETMEQVLPALQIAMGKQKPILFICNNSMGEGHSALIVQKVKGNFPICVVNAPSFGDQRKEYLMDISAITSSSILGNEFGRELKTCKESDLGTCEKIIVTKDKTIIIGGQGKKENIEKRVVSIRQSIEQAEGEYEKEELKKRLAKLSGGQAIIRAGGITPASISELKDRLDDAMNATRCAIEEGVLPGGGIGYLNAISDTTPLIVADMIRESFNQIMVNAGMENDIDKFILNRKKGSDEGLNVRTRKEENFFSTGVIDATKVCVSALENAVDVASLILLNNVVITNEYFGSQREVKRFEVRAD